MNIAPQCIMILHDKTGLCVQLVAGGCSGLGQTLQGWLLLVIEAEIGSLDKAQRYFVAICATVHEDNPGGEVRVVRQ